MRLVQDNEGVLEVSWMWLPFWLAVHPHMKNELERDMREAGLLNRITNAEEDMDAMHVFVRDRLQELFPHIEGLAEYLDGMKYVTL